MELKQGNTASASAALQEAVALREKYPDDIWELAEARERLGEALAKSGSAAAPPLLKKASQDLESTAAPITLKPFEPKLRWHACVPETPLRR